MDNQVIVDYQAGMSLSACARKYQEDKRNIRKFLVSNHIHIRDRHEQCIIENKRRGYKVNHMYFSVIDSNEKAYYLGFFAADGSISKNNNSLKIAVSDIDHMQLELFRSAIQSEASVKHYITNNGFEIAEFRWSSSQMKKDMEKYSIVPNKTYKGITIGNIPSQFQLAFLLGYFDGDGSFSWNKKTKQCSIKIVSHTRKILDEFSQLLVGYFGSEINPKIYYAKTRDIYSLELSTLPSIKILDTLYSLDGIIPLYRKYNKFQEFKGYRIKQPKSQDILDNQG